MKVEIRRSGLLVCCFLCLNNASYHLLGAPFESNLYDWLLLLFRWLHIVTAISWIGTSVFFMWLDEALKK